MKIDPEEMEDLINAGMVPFLEFMGELDIIHGVPPTTGEERQAVRRIIEAVLERVNKE